MCYCLRFNIELFVETDIEYNNLVFQKIKERVNSFNISNLKSINIEYDNYILCAVIKYNDDKCIGVSIEIDSPNKILFNCKFDCEKEEFSRYYSRCLVITTAMFPDIISVYDVVSGQYFDRKFIPIFSKYDQAPSMRLFGIETNSYPKYFTLKTCGLTRLGIPDIIIFLPTSLKRTSSSIIEYQNILNFAALEAIYNKTFREGGIVLAGKQQSNNYKIPISLVPVAVSNCYRSLDAKCKSVASDCSTIMVYETKAKYDSHSGTDLFEFNNVITDKTFKTAISKHQIEEWKVSAQFTLQYISKIVMKGTKVTVFASNADFSEISITTASDNVYIITNYNSLTGNFIGRKVGSNKETIITSEDIYWWQYSMTKNSKDVIVSPYTPIEYKITTVCSKI